MYSQLNSIIKDIQGIMRAGMFDRNISDKYNNELDNLSQQLKISYQTAEDNLRGETHFLDQTKDVVDSLPKVLESLAKEQEGHLQVCTKILNARINYCLEQINRQGSSSLSDSEMRDNPQTSHKEIETLATTVQKQAYAASDTENVLSQKLGVENTDYPDELRPEVPSLLTLPQKMHEVTLDLPSSSDAYQRVEAAISEIECVKAALSERTKRVNKIRELLCLSPREHGPQRVKNKFIELSGRVKLIKRNLDEIFASEQDKLTEDISNMIVNEIKSLGVLVKKFLIEYGKSGAKADRDLAERAIKAIKNWLDYLDTALSRYKPVRKIKLDNISNPGKLAVDKADNACKKLLVEFTQQVDLTQATLESYEETNDRLQASLQDLERKCAEVKPYLEVDKLRSGNSHKTKGEKFFDKIKNDREPYKDTTSNFKQRYDTRLRPLKRQKKRQQGKDPIVGRDVTKFVRVESRLKNQPLYSRILEPKAPWLTTYIPSPLPWGRPGPFFRTDICLEGKDKVVYVHCACNDKKGPIDGTEQMKASEIIFNHLLYADKVLSQKSGAKKTDHLGESRLEAPSFPDDQRSQTTLPRNIEKILPDKTETNEKGIKYAKNIGDAKSIKVVFTDVIENTTIEKLMDYTKYDEDLKKNSKDLGIQSEVGELTVLESSDLRFFKIFETIAGKALLYSLKEINDYIKKKGIKKELSIKDVYIKPCDDSQKAFKYIIFNITDEIQDIT